MIEIARILCPFDFSPFSEQALEHAAVLARWYDASITALHVFTPVPGVDVISGLAAGSLPSATLSDSVHRDLAALLQTVVERHADSGVRVQAVLALAPSIHREILDRAAEARADLIVMGTHGRSGFEHLLLGSVTEKVLRKATCPVLVIPRRAEAETGEAAVHVRRILCPIDFSTASDAAFAYALSLAEEADARLTLLHVVDVPQEVRDPSIATGFRLDELLVEAEAAALTRLRALVPAAARDYCTVQTAVAEGRPSRAILAQAEAEQSDLIVMGVRGRGAVNLAVFGSNAHQVIRSGTCPVLVVHPAA